MPFAVIGMGRFGGRELSYASDLDVLFVYDGDGPADYHEAERVATQLLAEIGERTPRRPHLPRSTPRSDPRASRARSPARSTGTATTGSATG